MTVEEIVKIQGVLLNYEEYKLKKLLREEMQPINEEAIKIYVSVFNRKYIVPFLNQLKEVKK